MRKKYAGEGDGAPDDDEPSATASLSARPIPVKLTRYKSSIQYAADSAGVSVGIFAAPIHPSHPGGKDERELFESMYRRFNPSAGRTKTKADVSYFQFADEWNVIVSEEFHKRSRGEENVRLLRGKKKSHLEDYYKHITATKNAAALPQENKSEQKRHNMYKGLKESRPTSGPPAVRPTQTAHVASSEDTFAPAPQARSVIAGGQKPGLVAAERPTLKTPYRPIPKAVRKTRPKANLNTTCRGCGYLFGEGKEGGRFHAKKEKGPNCKYTDCYCGALKSEHPQWNLPGAYCFKNWKNECPGCGEPPNQHTADRTPGYTCDLRWRDGTALV